MNSDDAILKKFQKELNAGSISLVVLSLMNRAAEPMYGYQIAKRLDAAIEGAPLMKQGTLYPVLRALQANDLLSSEVEPSVSGPPRRYYAITDKGRDMLDRWVGAWQRTRDFVDDVLAQDGPKKEQETGEQDHG